MAAGDVGALGDPQTLPLNELDVSDLRRFELDCWKPHLERLRRELSIHFQAESPAGAFWSITRYGRTTFMSRPRRICNDSVREYSHMPVQGTRF